MAINKELLKGSVTTLVLTALSKRELYGYELIKEIEVGSKGFFSLKEGTLYPILHSLETDRHVESYWEGQEGERRRKYYRITKSGRKLLESKKREWIEFRLALDQILSDVKARNGLQPC